MNNKKLLRISLIICALAILMASAYEYQQKIDINTIKRIFNGYLI